MGENAVCRPLDLQRDLDWPTNKVQRTRVLVFTTEETITCDMYYVHGDVHAGVQNYPVCLKHDTTVI